MVYKGFTALSSEISLRRCAEASPAQFRQATSKWLWESHLPSSALGSELDLFQRTTRAETARTLGNRAGQQSRALKMCVLPRSAAAAARSPPTGFEALVAKPWFLVQYWSLTILWQPQVHSQCSTPSICDQDQAHGMPGS